MVEALVLLEFLLHGAGGGGDSRIRRHGSLLLIVFRLVMVVALVLLAGAAGGGDSRIRWHGAASPGGYGRPARRGDAVLGLPSFRVRQRSCPFSRRAALHPPEDDRRQAPGCIAGFGKDIPEDLNEIAEKVEASNQRWYKFILTETICSLRRHNNCCISLSLSVDVKDTSDSWEHHFDKISIEERSKFDEETLYNLEGIKRKKRYSRKPDGFRNEYIVLTILVAADGTLKLPEVRNYADLEATVETLNSIPARRIHGIQVLWTPQDEDDVLLEEIELPFCSPPPQLPNSFRFRP
ncbi:hypothetical protein PVAP13_6KG021450 [Panicum virgatum]|uniref:Uncharacterized protein n=1 Tax=Panicum virgatum TaxID=38727 RepID=A0A8T0R8I5_PANVG|nr:hypothetical protein PVAP13_6KG021450 [Panicum virgatum]